MTSLSELLQNHSLKLKQHRYKHPDSHPITPKLGKHCGLVKHCEANCIPKNNYSGIKDVKTLRTNTAILHLEIQKTKKK